MLTQKVTLPLVEMVERTGCDIATCGMLIKSEEDKNNPNVVKIIMGLKEGEKEARCLYFTRATAPYTRNPENAQIKIYIIISAFMFSKHPHCKKWFRCRPAFWKNVRL